MPVLASPEQDPIEGLLQQTEQTPIDWNIQSKLTSAEAAAADQEFANKVNQIDQAEFDKFSPNTDPTATWSRTARVAAQTGVRAMHFVEQGTGGRGAHDTSSRERRVEERAKVGLPPSELMP